MTGYNGRIFERFTEQARQVIVGAQEEARLLKHNYIGTEHVLLGLLREPRGVAARALERLGVIPERVREDVVRIRLRRGSPHPRPSPVYSASQEGA